MLISTCVGEDTWFQFRGPTGQGQVSVALPVEWGRADEKSDSYSDNVLWRTEIQGLGHSSPVHDGKRIWLSTASRDGLVLGAVCVNAEDGEILHSVVIFRPSNVEEIHHDNSYASPTPVLAGNRLIVHFGTYGTACLDSESGQILWTNTDFPVEHQGGPGSSPVVYQDRVILTLDGAQQQKLVALNLNDGKVAWTRERSAPFRPNPITHRAFATPLLVSQTSQAQLISPGADQCHAYDPKTGEELWHVRYVGFSTVPCPVARENRVFFCTGFYKPQLWCVDLTGRGDVTDSHIPWKFRGPVPETPSPLLFDEGAKIFLVSNKGIATCVDAETGERLWILRLGGNYSSSPTLANGLIYCCNEDGVTKVIDPSGEEPQVVANNKLFERIMASPAVIGEDLLLRTEAAIYRIAKSTESVR